MEKEIKEQINNATGWGIIMGFLFGGMIGMAILSICIRFNSDIEIPDWRALLAFFIFFIVMAVVFTLVHWKIINRE